MIGIRVRVFETGQRQTALLEQTVENSFRIGRQEEGEPGEIAVVRSASARSTLDQKLIIATGFEREYSRQFAEVHLSGGAVRIHNTSPHAIDVGSTPLAAGESRDIELKSLTAMHDPIELTFCDRTIELVPIESPQRKGSVYSLDTTPGPPTLLPISQATIDSSLSLVGTAAAATIESNRLLDLLQTMLNIFQDSPDNLSFFDRAAMAMIQFLQLDHVLVAFHESAIGELTFNVKGDQSVGPWRFHVFHQKGGGASGEWMPSIKILSMIAQDKKTVYELPQDLTQSLVDVNCLVASPLLNFRNEVVGVVYADRGVDQQHPTLTEAEAMFVELFAKGISQGIERLNRERKISEMRLKFNQFFTSELADELESNPDLLAPRSAEVSILFADIRGFSRISERIGAGPTISWINSVMNELSDCVFRHNGVVVDYVGDEILAMWGAPIDREGHRELAVRTALEMLSCIPQLNARWEPILGEPLSIGVGINSGTAQVGNIGSDRKFKYGPLGDVVNVASRVQSSTRQMGTTFLVTESTAEALPAEIPRRKIRTVRFVNVKRPIAVYEVPLNPGSDWIELQKVYEQGLAFFEQGRLREASQTLAGIINRHPDDTPAVQLLSDTVSGLSQSDFDSVLSLSKK